MSCHVERFLDSLPGSLLRHETLCGSKLSPDLLVKSKSNSVPYRKSRNCGCDVYTNYGHRSRSAAMNLPVALILQRFYFAVSQLTGLSVLSIFLGCVSEADQARRSDISFSIDGESRLWFSSVHGLISRADSDGDVKNIIDLSPAKVLSVNCDKSSDRIAIGLEDGSGKQVINIYAYDEDSTSLNLEHSFAGSNPCFSSNDSLLFYSKADRFVPATTFGGGYWTEFGVWQFDLQNLRHDQLSEDRLFLVDDLAYDSTSQKLYLSAMSGGGEGVQEQIMELDLATHSLKTWGLSFDDAAVCSGDPGLGEDGRFMVFVSDRRLQFHYELYLYDFAASKTERLTDGNRMRFLAHPEFDGDSLYFLGASGLTDDNFPSWQIYAIRNFEPSSSSAAPSVVIKKSTLYKQVNSGAR